MGRLFLTKFLVAFEVASLLLLIAAVGAVILARRRSGLEDPREISVADVHARGPRRHRGSRRRPSPCSRPAGRAQAMSMEWYLVVSALIFSIGAGGVLVRRNPLVILLCLELMLNGANLALVTFSRMHGNRDGQMFALIVMVVAACEVAVGLGLIVAMFRRRLPIDVDELRELQGEPQTSAWIVLAVPARRLPDHRAQLEAAAVARARLDRHARDRALVRGRGRRR